MEIKHNTISKRINRKNILSFKELTLSLGIFSNLSQRSSFGKLTVKLKIFDVVKPSRFL